MTSHDPQAMTDSPEESRSPVSAAPQMNGEGAAASPAAESATTHRESSTNDVVVADDDLAELRARWAGLQAAFVDDPKDCVQQADLLVSDLFEQLTTGFAAVRSRLEEQWSRGEEASTEDLRLILKRYREFFERLLAV
jgi:hypothetical protein